MKTPNRIDYSIKVARDSRKALELGEIVHICNIRQDSITALDNEIATRNMQIKKDIGINYTVYQQRRKRNE